MADAKDDGNPVAPAPNMKPRGWRELWMTEDYWAIWLGFLLVAVGLFVFLPRPPEGMNAAVAGANKTMVAEAKVAPFKTTAWYKASDTKKKMKATSQDWYKKGLKKWLSKPHKWKGNVVEAFVLSKEEAAAKKESATKKFEPVAAEAEQLLAQARSAEEAARQADFKDGKLDAVAKAAIAKWRDAKHVASKAKKKAGVKPYNQAGYLVGLCAAMALFFGIGIKFMGESPRAFLVAFPFVFLVAVLSYLMASQATMREYGVGYAAWGIVFGLLVSNTILTPAWVKPAVRTEYYIKTGLVLLGAEVLFGKILAIGAPGVFVAWVVTPVVLISTYVFGVKCLPGVSKTLNVTISAAASVCGVSAAIATAAACRAKKEELTLAVGMSLVFTSIMMILMPMLIKAGGMDHVIAGAWMGGTIDATGAVAAAGEFLGDRALYVAATVKMIQNVLIGVVAFCVAVYWCARVDTDACGRVSPMEIWYRFPKFVIGFVVASVVCSLIYQSLGSDAGHAMIDYGLLRGFTKILRGWFFCLAFVSIGLATNFRELRQHFSSGQSLALYVAGQSLNLIITLAMVYLMFRVVFPGVAEKI